ncbi:MAG: penicillin-binding protein 2 [Thermoanaerobaculia bacterium]
MKSRLLVCLVVLASWAAVAGARLYRLQVEQHETYREKASRQQQGAISLHAPRGTIYDARGRELAVSMTVESAFAVPYEVESPRETARSLARVLDLDANELASELAEQRSFVWVARQLDPPQAEAVRDLDLPGIHFLEESKRYYPQRELAAQVLGFVGVDNQGLGGLEALFDETVAGEALERRVLRDARRGHLLYAERSIEEPEPGENLHLTLDATVQYILERELGRGLEKFSGKSATGVVLDPRTGAVLAMASLPGFDPNRYREFPEARRRNRVVQDAYEPGSTFKLITAASVLEANLADPADVFDCGRGSIVVYGKRINDHRSFDRLSFREVIARSSNVGAIRLGLLAGPERLHATIERFGFGRLTGIDLPGESPGLARPLESWQKRSVAYISFGQEISVTPLQLAVAFGAIANGGVLYRPYVVDSGAPPEVVGRPIAESTARSLERMLEAVVEDGTAKLAAVPGYTVAGKTGTAEKAIPGQGYVAGRYVASFVGFVPARDPRLVALIVVDEPRGPLYHGGDVAAGIFSATMQQALLYLGVPPDRRDGTPWGELDRVASVASSDGTDTLR